MDLMEFKDKLFIKAKEAGITEYEIYYTKSDNLNINVYMGEVDKYSVNNSMGVGFRGIIEDKMGYSYTSKLDEDALDLLVQGVKDSALAIDSDDKGYILGTKETYTEVKSFNEELKNVPVEEKIQLVLEIDKETRARSNKLVNVSYCGVGFYEQEIGLINSNGIELRHKDNFAFAAVTPVLSDGDRNYNSMSYIATRNFDSISASKLAADAIKETETYMGAESIKSGNYEAIIRNDVAADLLDTFSGIFSAENVQRGYSLLKGKKDQLVASKKVILVDDPLLKDVMVSIPFDGEGTAAYKKNVIEKGILKTYLYNLKTAFKDGVKSTGNASRPSYSSSIGIAPTNFYFEKGSHSLEDMIKAMKEGILITDIAGTHAGANMITGDFSLAAKGFYIENGKIVKPVEQITISGNFFEMLKCVEECGNDLKFGLPSGSSCVGSPSLKIEKISVAGI